MSRNIKIILIAIVTIIATLIICYFSIGRTKNTDDSGKLNIVTTTFASYDFAKQIVGDKAKVTYLLGPGVDAHSYDPSATDLIKIQKADVFIFIGGEMEKWVDKVFESNSIDKNKTTLIKVTEAVETIEETEVDGAEEEEEEVEGAFDEHIWTSPANAIKMVTYLAEQFGKIDSKNKEEYEKNGQVYNNKIEEVQSQIQEIVANKVRNRLVFGDKMPMQYFLNEFGLTSSAAFNGCSTETEPSVKTITYLIGKVKEENIPVVFYIELSTGKTAKSIANETGAKAVQIQTLHNVSKDDFENGETYVSLMKKNLPVLKEALQ